jgi:hypothetical protein
VFAGEGMQFESHLGHVFSLFRGLGAAEVCTKLLWWAPAGPTFVGGGWSGGSFSWLGQRCCCVLLHGRERLVLHDLLRVGIKFSASSLSGAGTPGKVPS